MLEVDISSVVIQAEEICRPVVGKCEAAMEIGFSAEMLFPVNRLLRELAISNKSFSSETSDEGSDCAADHRSDRATTDCPEAGTNGSATGCSCSGSHGVAVWFSAQGIAMSFMVVAIWWQVHEDDLAPCVP